jgi:hypothetical protein
MTTSKYVVDPTLIAIFIPTTGCAMCTTTATTTAHCHTYALLQCR